MLRSLRNQGSSHTPDAVMRCLRWRSRALVQETRDRVDVAADLLHRGTQV